MIAAPLRPLAGVVVALSLAVLLEWTLPDVSGETVSFSSPNLSYVSPKVPVIRQMTTNWATTILARPLFSASRRPPPIATDKHPDAAPEKARLSGIMIGRFGRWAIFATADGGRPLVLTEGAQVNDSTIRRIDPDRVVLTNGLVSMLPLPFHMNRVATTHTLPLQRDVPNHFNPTFGNGHVPTAGLSLALMPPLPPQMVDPGQPSTDGQRALAVSIFHGPNIANRRE